jgi:hypothetical protein
VNKRIATVAFILFLALTTVAYGSYSIYSNIVNNAVSDYTFGTMTTSNAAPQKNQNVTFTGTLKLGTAPAAGKTVFLMRTTDNSTWTQAASNVTDTTGTFIFTVNCTQVGHFTYKARFDVP